MTREIKFRAWNRNSERIFHVDALFMHEGDPVSVSHKGGTLLVGTDCDLMQFTGLKDRSGAEIYEGDIVEFGDNPIHEGQLCKVEWLTGRVGFYYTFLAGPNKGKCTDMIDNWRTYKVIGNVHQNPELKDET